MYELIKKKVTEEIEKQTKETKECFTKEGYEFTYKRYLTDLRIKQLQDGIITLGKALEIATKKLLKEDAKRLENKLKHIEKVANAEEVDNIRVSIEWHKNRTWGNNPFCECWALGYTTGSASGWGYDKESTAIATAFNKNNGILKLVYNAYEKKLQENYNITPHEALGYGLGYGALPYFEGGVGASCFTWFLKSIGFTCEESHGKHYDSYIFEK